MVEDIEIGVRLKPDTSELEDVEDRQVGVSGAGGAGGTGRERGDAAAGGFAGAELGELLGPGAIIVGLLAGILSQLKPVTQFVGLIFRILSRALLPAIQLLVVALRPLLTSLASTSIAAENPERVFQGAQRQAAKDIGLQANQGPALSLGSAGFGQVATGISTGNVGQIGSGVEAIETALTSRKSTADHTDENKKQQDADFIQEILELIP